MPLIAQLERFTEQWLRLCEHMLPLESASASGDAGHLYHGSYSLLLSHEDKQYPGALIASLAIPWGEAMGNEDMGGYHLVWTRDMVNSATGQDLRNGAGNDAVVSEFRHLPQDVFGGKVLVS